MKYHKIKTVYERDPENKYKTLIMGKYATPELDYLKSNDWVFTEKVDGTNIRVIWDGKKMRFGGRTNNAQIPTFLYDKLGDLFSEAVLLEKFGDAEVILFGEGFGARIQKGGGNYIPDGVSFVLFDVYIGMWLKREDVENIANSLSIDVVPIIGEGGLVEAVNLAMRGITSTWGDFPAEGLVMRPRVEMCTRAGHRVITKIKTKDFN
jgi:ATP-dependent RNA circularization protein (DNA/RNA ligase family)